MQPIEEQFWSKVDKSGGPDACWLWARGRTKGYGRLRLGGKLWRAHRLAWQCVHGLLADDIKVLHTCDNPPCCNPAHLYAGTQLDNAADRDSKGRGATGDRNGTHTHPEVVRRGEKHRSAKLTEAQVLQIRALYRSGNVTQKQLASEYGVKRSSIGGITLRQKWAWLHDEG
jgi:hypothetical protein